VLPRLLVFAFIFQRPSVCVQTDSAGYLKLAHHVRENHIFATTLSPFTVYETVRTPGYPFFLTPFVSPQGERILLIAFVQSSLGIITCWIAWRWMASVFPARGAIFGTLVLALDPVMVLHTPLVMAETLLSFFLLGALLATWRALSSERWQATAQSGFLWSICAMIKPVSLYLPIFISLRWIRQPKKLAAFLLTAYLLPGLWVARNNAKAHFPGFTSLDGIVLLRYPAANIRAFLSGRSVLDAEQELIKDIRARSPSGWKNQSEQSRAYGKEAQKIMRAHPWLFLKVNLVGAGRLLGGLGLEIVADLLGKERPG